MSYSDLYLRSKKNTTLTIVASAVMILFVLFLYGSKISGLPSRAVVKSLKRHEVVNLFPSQATVYWASESEEVGWILYGETKETIGQIGLDDRDVGGKKAKAFFHFVTMKNLKPNTQYYYKIVSNNEIIKTSNLEYFSFRTPSNDTASSSMKPAYGKVISASGVPVQNAIVLYRYKDTYAQATLTKSSGEWLIPLQHLVDVKTNQFIEVNEVEKVRVEITDGVSTVSTIDALVRFTNPMPQTIILGKNYEFLEDANVLPANTSRVEDPDKKYEFAITLPKENALIPSSRPLLKGTAEPGKQIKISINSEPEYIARIKADSQGVWYVDVPVSFIAGSYTLKVAAEDQEGKELTIDRKFTIVKSGEQVLGDATPSGTLSPTATPTTIPTATPSAIPSITITLTPTITQPLFTATPVASMSPSILPTSGALDSNPLLWGSVGMIILGAGLLFVF